MNTSRTTQWQPDICIVGAGPAGLSAAVALGDAGREVLVVESGSALPTKAAQELNEGEYEGEPYIGLDKSRHRQVGGTPNIWNVPVNGGQGAKYVPLSRGDLTDWPLDFDELRPYYEEAQAFCGLGPFQYGADYWATSDRQPFDLSGTALESAVYQYGPNTLFTRGLPRQLLELNAVTLMSSTTVVKLTTVGAKRLARVEASGEDGQPIVISPKALILACGAIENARLLLLAGLVSDSEWLGRGFMEHPRDFNLSIIPHSPDLLRASVFYDQHESATGHLISGRLTLGDTIRASYEVPNASMLMYPRPRTSRSLVARLRRRMLRSQPDRPHRYGWSAQDIDPSSLADFRLIVEAEQRPHHANRVELSGRTDRFGNSLPRLVLNWTAGDQAEFDRLRLIIAESLRSARIGELKYELGGRPNLSAHHHAGTTRIGLSPEDGVVSREGRLFQSENIFVAGASTFPTAGFANPTLTIVAMAIRLARHIDQALP